MSNTKTTTVAAGGAYDKPIETHTLKVDWPPWPENITARAKDVSAKEFMERQFSDPGIKAVFERLSNR